jgi:lysophospholipase L1-like esterase
VYETKWGINEPVVKNEIIPILQKVAKDKNATIIDLYAPLSGKPELFPDKIHPNAAGAKLMAETIAKSVGN